MDALSVTAALGGCQSATVEVVSKIDRAGGWTLAGYGTLLVGGLAAEAMKDVGTVLGSAIGSAIACTPALVLGAEPEDCPRAEAKDEGDPWVPILVAGIPAAVDMATGALNARYPNPLVIELDCAGAPASADEDAS